eukprot:15363614-Alexandrium_andersonii.AAC.1
MCIRDSRRIWWRKSLLHRRRPLPARSARDHCPRKGRTSARVLPSAKIAAVGSIVVVMTLMA